MYATLLEQLCDLLAPPVLILRTSLRRVNLSAYLKILLNICFIRGIMIKNMKCTISCAKKYKRVAHLDKR